MESYTLGSASMLAACFNALPGHYDMSLNMTDMQTLLVVLSAACGFTELDTADEDAAMSLYSSIAETLGVEGI